MKKGSVLLVAVNAKYIHSNLAVYSLKANAGRYSDRVELAEYTINHQCEEILRGIYRYSPKVVGFSCYIWNISCVLQVAADLRKVLPEVKILLGGPEVSYDATQLLEKYPFVDVILVGEGEATFRELLARYEEEGPEADLSGIAGLCLRTDTGCRMTPAREPVRMDDLVFPYKDVDGFANRIVYYETMRGCPYSCSYCLSSVEKTVRTRSLSLVLQELQFFLDHGVRQVKFVDRTFNCNHEHAFGIWSYIRDHDNGVTNFHFEIGGELLREEDFELFEKFRPGLVQFEIGVQTTNPETLAAIRRKMDFSRLCGHIKRIRGGHRIHQHLDLIAGLPYEDYDSFHRSFNDVYAMRPDQLQLGFLKVLKGSYMEEEARGYGIRYGSMPPYEVLATEWLPYRDVLRLKRIEEMVEVYYNSLQYPATISLLELCCKDAFAMYEGLGEYYDRNGYFDLSHSRIARYEILWHYAEEFFGERAGEFRQTLTYDLYLRDYVKNPPEFVRERSREYAEAVREYFHDAPAGYEGFAAKQLFHMIYVDEFTLDFDKLINEKIILHRKPYSLAFDYRNRDPLSHSAAVREIVL